MKIQTFLGPEMAMNEASAIWVQKSRGPPPHPYRPWHGTMKKSTAPFKVHNIRLYCTVCTQGYPLVNEGFHSVIRPQFEITSEHGRSHLSSTAHGHLANPSLPSTKTGYSLEINRFCPRSRSIMSKI